MPQVFHPSFNSISKVSIAAIGGLVVGVFALLGVIQRSPWWTEVDVVVEQPVPFSHQHHVGGLGIDCRYCHTSVEDSAFAGMPPTETCIGCHRYIWSNAEMLEPVHESWRTGEPLVWNRVNDVPDFVYFNHGVHVSGGVACRTCHGDVEEMPLMWQSRSLYMEWCLQCHRHPETAVDPGQDLFGTGAGRDEPDVVERQAPRYGQVPETEDPRAGILTNCSACHR